MSNKLADLARDTVSAKRAAPAEEAEGAKSTRRPSTFHIDRDLSLRVKDAVIHLMGPPAYMTLSQFVEHALAVELERLSDTYNKGKPFPPAPGRIKLGRPMANRS